MGIGDAFAEKRRIGRDYSLGEFEDGEIYLWVQGQSTSMAGPIRQIAWSQDFIIVNSPISGSKWMIIRIHDHRALSGPEKTEAENRLLKTLQLMNPKEAWEQSLQTARMAR